MRVIYVYLDLILSGVFVFFKASFFGGSDKLPVFLARQTIPGLGIVVDPCAALLIMIVTILLCFGIKEVLTFQNLENENLSQDY